jgi:hypothetical protein
MEVALLRLVSASKLAAQEVEQRTILDEEVEKCWRSLLLGCKFMGWFG